MKFITGEWLKSAEGDLQTMEALKAKSELTHIASFHAHQAVEKCFKAVLEEKSMEIEKIHNLIKLYGKIKAVINFPVDMDKLEILNSLYIDARYPSGMGLLPDGKPSTADVDEFYDFAKDINKRIKAFVS
jgi:HEPN domain-containing protein